MPELVSTDPRPNRLQSLDALRGIAAMTVLLYHFTRRYGELFHVDWHPWFSYDGQFGVLLFFMISGYVITLTTERVKKPTDFLFFRFSRLYPTYWFCMFLTAGVLVLAKLPPEAVSYPSWLSLGVNLTMLTKTIRRFVNMNHELSYIDGSYWSLEIELFFYAVIFLLLMTRKTHRIVLVAAVFVVLGFVDDLFNRENAADIVMVGKILAALGHSPALHKKLVLAGSIFRWLCFLSYWPYFAIGISVFARQKRGERIGPSILLLLSAGAIIFHITQMTGFSSSPRESLITLAKILASGVLFVAAVYNVLPPLRWRPLVFIGAISYPLYLLHQYVGYVVIHSAMAHGLGINTAIALAVLVGLILGTVVSFGVERPTMHALRLLYLRWTHHHALPTPISGMAPTIPETSVDRQP